MPGKSIERTCVVCGQGFLAWPAVVRAGKARFCSHSCYAQSLRGSRPGQPTIARTCEMCGIRFWTHEVHVQRGQARFCSLTCFGASRRIGQEVNCAACGKPFYVPARHTKRGKYRYCSNACRGVGQRDLSGTLRNGWLYDVWREAVLHRDKQKCQRCGATTQLCAHHVQTWDDAPALRFEVANGLTLCRACHVREHEAGAH